MREKMAFPPANPKEVRPKKETRLSAWTVLLLGKLSLAGVGCLPPPPPHFSISLSSESEKGPQDFDAQYADLEKRINLIEMADIHSMSRHPLRKDASRDLYSHVQGLEHLATAGFCRDKKSCFDGVQRYIHSGLPSFLSKPEAIAEISFQPNIVESELNIPQLRKDAGAKTVGYMHESQEGWRIVISVDQENPKETLRHELTHTWLHSLPLERSIPIWDRLVRYIDSPDHISFFEEEVAVDRNSPYAKTARADEWLAEGLSTYLTAEAEIVAVIDEGRREDIEKKFRISCNYPSDQLMTDEDLVAYAWLWRSYGYQDRPREPISLRGFQTGLKIIRDIMATDPSYDWHMAARVRLKGFTDDSGR